MVEALIDAALRSLALTAIVWLILRAPRLRPPQIQLAAWTLVVVASLAMPAATKLSSEIAPPIAAPSFEGFAPSFEGLIPSPPPAAAPPLPALASPWPDFRTAAVALYAAVAGVLLIRMLVGLALTARLTVRSRRLREHWTAGRHVRVSCEIAVPATFGSVILLPRDHAGWPKATRMAVLAHEGAHVARGDFYVLLAAQLNRALFWFCPWSWWLHDRLAALAEEASDDAAIARLRDRGRYAEILLAVSRRAPAPRAGVAMAKPATVRARIERILAESRMPTFASRGVRLALAAAILPVVLAVIAPFAHSSPEPSVPLIDEQVAPHARIPVDPALLDADVGFYEDKATETVMSVTREDDHLIVVRTGRAAAPEYAYAPHDFFSTTAAEQDSFTPDARGKVIRVLHKKYGLATAYERIDAERAAKVDQDFERRLAEEMEPRTPIKLDPATLDRFVGFYQLNPTYVFAITREGGQLFAQGTDQRRFAVFPYSASDFFYTIVAAQLSFQASADGPATGLVLHQDGKDRLAPRIAPEAAKALSDRLAEERMPHNAIALASADLDRYVGRYANSRIAMTISREGDHLSAQVLGYNRYRVYPYSARDFFATTFAVQISFEKDAAGHASRLVRHEHGEDQMLARVE